MEEENPAKLFEDLKDVRKEDKIQAELEANIPRQESLASGIKETSTLDEERSSDPGKQLKCAFESVPENFGNKTLGETSETEINENEKIQYQNTESVELQILEPDFQECEKVTGEIVEPKLNDEKWNVQSEINDVILKEEIPMVYDKLDVKEDIAEVIIQNERGITEYHSLSSGDDTYHEVEKCDPPQAQTIETIISESMLTTTLSLKKNEKSDLAPLDGDVPLITKESNEVAMETQDNKKLVDFSILESEVSENIEQKIIEQGDNHSEKHNSGENLLNVTKESTLADTVRTASEGVDNLNCDETTNSMSKIPINECEDVDKQSVHVEKQVMDEKEDVEKAPRVVFEETEINSADDVVKTLRSLPMEETNADEFEKKIDQEQPIMRHIGNIKDDNIEIEDSFDVKTVEEKGIQNKPLEEEGDTPTEDSKVQSQEVVPDINNMDSLSTEKNNELTITTEQSSQEVSKYDEVFNIENLNKDNDCPSTAQSLGEGLIVDMGKTCKETSDLHFHDSGETEIEEAHETRIDGSATEGNQSKGNECIKPENLNEEITEKRESGSDREQKFVSDEETIEGINQADKVKVEESPIEKIEDTLRIEQIKSENEELSEEIQKGTSSTDILIHDTHEDIAVKDKDLVLHERKNESPADDAERNNFKEAAAKLDLEKLFDKKNAKEGTEAILLSEEVVPHSELALDTEDTNKNKGTTITESEEDPNTDLSVRQATCPATVEAVHENVEKFAVVNNESFMECEKPEDTSLQSSNNGLEVKDNLKLDQKITPETEITYVKESSVEEIPDDDMNIKEDDNKHDLVLDKNIAVEGKTEERAIINDEREQTESKEPLEESTRETDKKPHDADTNNTISKSTDESEKPRECPDIPFPNIALLQKDSIANLSGVSETTQNIKEPEEISDFRSEKQIPEKYHNENEDTIVATCDKDVQLTDDLEKTEIEKSKPRNSVNVESEQEAVKCDEEKKTDNVDDENISLSSLLEMSTRETMQMHGQVSEVKQTTRPNEETQTEKADALQEEEAKTDEEKCEDDEHKKNESSSDSLVIVEASKDTDAKIVMKKHHGFISGVGSKVKHSISKVKKAITGKSSHSKSTSPK